jgi:hypothetical protein
MNVHLLLFSLLVLSCNIQIKSQTIRPVEANGKWGYVGSDNEWKVKPKYDGAKPLTEGMGAIKVKNLWGFIGESGKIAIKPRFIQVLPFSEGVAAVEIATPLGNRWGYINFTGTFVIEPQYTYAESFKNAQALVTTPTVQPKEKFIIDPSGTAITPPFMKKSLRGDRLKLSTLVPNTKDSAFCFVHIKGEQLTPWYLSNFELGKPNQKVCLPSKSTNSNEPDDVFLGNLKLLLYAVINEKGQVISPWFEEIESFHLGYAPVRKNNRFGFVHTDYQWVCEPQFISIKLLHEGIYSAQLEEEIFVLTNHKGEIISPRLSRYDHFYDHKYLGYHSLHRTTIREYEKAVFNHHGQQVSPWFTELFSSSNYITRGYVHMAGYCKPTQTREGLWYNYFNDTCSEMLSTWRPVTTLTVNGSTQANFNKDSVLKYFHAPNTSYAIDESFFKEIFYLDFEYVSGNDVQLIFSGNNFRDGIALISWTDFQPQVWEINGLMFSGHTTKYGLMDWNGKQLVPYKFDYLSGGSNSRAIIREWYTTAGGQKAARFGAVDYQGKLVIKPQFDLMGNFGDGLAPVYSNEKKTWGYVNQQGKLVLTYQYDDVRPFKFGYAAVKKDGRWGVINTAGKEILPFEYRKAPTPKNSKQIDVLVDGVGYERLDV